MLVIIQFLVLLIKNYIFDLLPHSYYFVTFTLDGKLGMLWIPGQFVMLTDLRFGHSSNGRMSVRLGESLKQIVSRSLSSLDQDISAMFVPTIVILLSFVQLARTANSSELTGHSSLLLNVTLFALHTPNVNILRFLKYLIGVRVVPSKL